MGMDRIIDRYIAIVNELAKNLNIKKNVFIQSVHYKKNHVQLFDQNKQSYIAKKVILTVPISMYKPNTPNHLVFHPPLSPVRKEAIEAFEMGYHFY